MSHQHSANCGCSEDAKQSSSISTSLYSSIDRDKAYCLNESIPHSIKKCLKPYSERNNSERLLSDPEDGEMLLYIPFETNVHIKTFTLMAWGDWQPKKVKLYINRDDLDLSSVHDTTCIQELELAEDTEGFLEYPLKLAKFQNVSSLIVFIPESVSGEGTQSGVQWINLKGVSTQTRREIVNVVYESRANPADHAKLTDQKAASMGY